MHFLLLYRSEWIDAPVQQVFELWAGTFWHKVCFELCCGVVTSIHCYSSLKLWWATISDQKGVSSRWRHILPHLIVLGIACMMCHRNDHTFSLEGPKLKLKFNPWVLLCCVVVYGSQLLLIDMLPQILPQRRVAFMRPLLSFDIACRCCGFHLWL